MANKGRIEGRAKRGAEILVYIYRSKWEFHGTGLRPMGTPIGKTTDGSVLGAQTYGETHRQNDTSLAGVPNTRTRTHGETHIEEEAALRAPT